jgi:ubiquinone/menaquinone biosynthesis C-methylase UbiE
VTEITKLIEQHYGRGHVLERVIKALNASDISPAHLGYEDLWPYDQLHSRGVAATREHAERAGIRTGMRVLDLGCGIGGSSRYLAGALGCRVIGVDLTPEYIDVARELTHRCGLTDRIEYYVGDALALPVSSGAFDRIFSHNVTMNIADKVALAHEVARVLVHDGKFSCLELARGPAGEVTFPVPWASEQAASFLVQPGDMRAALEAGGLRVLEELDLTEASKAAAKAASERNRRGEPPLQRNDVVMGDDFQERARNSSRGVMEGALLDILFIAQKP